MTKMHILIANDDGIFADGIRALSKAAVAAGHRVTIFAPDSQRSCVSHALTLFRSLHVKQVEYEDGVAAYAVDGTPADCVRLGLHLTKDDPVDYVLSGINDGSNRGAATIYSGTVGAAMEASLCGTPALAVSLCCEKIAEKDYSEAARIGIQTLEWIAKQRPLQRGDIYNLNVPVGERIKEIRSATLSYEHMFPACYTDDGEGGYRINTKVPPVPETDPDSDLNLTRAGAATLSILSWNWLSATPLPDLADLQREVEA